MSRSPEWNRLVTDADLGGPDWIDPAADHHRDLAALTRAIRAELAQAAYTVNGVSVPLFPMGRCGVRAAPAHPGALWKMMRPPSGNRRVLWLPGGRCFR